MKTILIQHVKRETESELKGNTEEKGKKRKTVKLCIYILKKYIATNKERKGIRRKVEE